MTDSSDVSLQPLSALREFAPRNRRERQREDGRQQQVKYPRTVKKLKSSKTVVMGHQEGGKKKKKEEGGHATAANLMAG